MKWTIRYYTSESSYKMGCPAYTETVYGDRSSAVNAALRRLKSNCNISITISCKRSKILWTKAEKVAIATFSFYCAAMYRIRCISFDNFMLTKEKECNYGKCI